MLDTSATAATTPSCQGLRCLDRDTCYSYDDLYKVTRLTHGLGTCDVEEITQTLTIAYITPAGILEKISVDKAQELMRCIYTSKLLFASSSMLRNYTFWGFTGTADDGFQPIQNSVDEYAGVSRNVAISHVALLQGGEDNALGLSATADLDTDEFLGEYTGVIQQVHDSFDTHDPYGICYPSVFEGGPLHVTALAYGNLIRCINHSFNPNARFVPMVQDGVLHIYCFTTRAIKSGEQIFVNYGPAYWKHAGIKPITC